HLLAVHAGGAGEGEPRRGVSLHQGRKALEGAGDRPLADVQQLRTGRADRERHAALRPREGSRPAASHPRPGAGAAADRADGGADGEKRRAARGVPALGDRPAGQGGMKPGVRDIVVDGTRALAFTTDSGLEFTVLVDRSLDIGPLSWRG